MDIRWGVVSGITFEAIIRLYIIFHYVGDSVCLIKSGNILLILSAIGLIFVLSSDYKSDTIDIIFWLSILMLFGYFLLLYKYNEILDGGILSSIQLIPPIFSIFIILLTIIAFIGSIYSD